MNGSEEEIHYLFILGLDFVYLQSEVIVFIRHKPKIAIAAKTKRPEAPSAFVSRYTSCQCCRQKESTSGLTSLTHTSSWELLSYEILH